VYRGYYVSCAYCASLVRYGASWIRFLNVQPKETNVLRRGSIMLSNCISVSFESSAVVFSVARFSEVSVDTTSITASLAPL
jgi:hypothetical protein